MERKVVVIVKLKPDETGCSQTDYNILQYRLGSLLPLLCKKQHKGHESKDNVFIKGGPIGKLDGITKAATVGHKVFGGIKPGDNQKKEHH